MPFVRVSRIAHDEGMPTIAIVGAGPGLGLALARTFGRHGYSAALVARNPQTLETLTATLAGEGIGAAWFAADTRDPAAVTQALQDAAARFGADSAQHNGIRDGWATVGVQTDAQAEAEPSEPPTSTDAELLLRRTGGIAGLVKERRTTLDELPAKDAKRWNKLLTSDTLQAISGGDPVADGFCYRVACEALSVDVTVPEHQLSESQRNLFKRTLHQG